MKIRFTAQEKGQRVILEEFEGQVLFQTDRVVTVYVPKSIAEKLGRERMNECPECGNNTFFWRTPARHSIARKYCSKCYQWIRDKQGEE